MLSYTFAWVPVPRMKMVTGYSVTKYHSCLNINENPDSQRKTSKNVSFITLEQLMFCQERGFASPKQSDSVLTKVVVVTKYNRCHYRHFSSQKTVGRKKNHKIFREKFKCDQ